jgi:hypothetical protein
MEGYIAGTREMSLNGFLRVMGTCTKRGHRTGRSSEQGPISVRLMFHYTNIDHHFGAALERRRHYCNDP